MHVNVQRISDLIKRYIWLVYNFNNDMDGFPLSTESWSLNGDSLTHLFIILNLEIIKLRWYILNKADRKDQLFRPRKTHSNFYTRKVLHISNRHQPFYNIIIMWNKCIILFNILLTMFMCRKFLECWFHLFLFIPPTDTINHVHTCPCTRCRETKYITLAWISYSVHLRRVLITFVNL